MAEGQERPLLFTTTGTEALPAHPALLGGACGACGYVFFPMQSYGCENCGSTELTSRPLTGRGKLVASARVHMHAAPGRVAPFTVGSIVTDDGAVVRAVLDVDAETPLPLDTVVTSLLVPETRPAHGAHDLRFAPAREI